MIKIGLIGRQGSGKDFSLAKATQKAEKTGKTITLVRMADPLKDFSRSIFQPFILEGSYTNNTDFEKENKEKFFNVPDERFRIQAFKQAHQLLGVLETISKENTLEPQELLNKMLSIFEPYKQGDFYHISPRLFQQLTGTDVFRQNVVANFWCLIAKAKIESMESDAVVCPDIRFQDESEVFDRLIYIYRPNHEQLSNPSHTSEILCETVHKEVVNAIHNGLKNGESVFVELLGRQVQVFFNDNNLNLADLIFDC